MRHQIMPKHSLVSAVKSEIHFASQNILKHNPGNAEFITKLLNRRWSLSCPDSKINQIKVLDRNGGGLNGGVSFHNITQPCIGEGMMEKTESFPSFYVVRDDLIHPLVNGNKARKLDALLPLLEDIAVTDVVTCGGCQSAHAAAVAVSCAERGLKSHLLLRGEEPEILTGYNLVSKLYGNVVYIPRSQYAKREEMLSKHAELVADLNGSVISLEDILESSFKNHESDQQKILLSDFVRRGNNLKKVVVINEGAGDAIALLGLMRLIQHLSQKDLFGRRTAINIVVDAGTGTTAVGLAIAALFLGLPWTVTAVMLADKIDNYKRKEQNLISEFLKSSSHSHNGLDTTEVNSGIVCWVDRSSPRKFGNILKGEVEECQRIAQQTGILVDPIYTLAGWELATQLSKSREKDDKVVMLHTGGTLGMFGLATRYKSYFHVPNFVLD